jgi:hypothetical protein
MSHLRRWGFAAGLLILAGCASDSSCGGHHGLFSRLTGRSREAECCPCPCPEDPCCDGMMGGAYLGPTSFESYAPPSIDIVPPPVTVQPSPAMAKPMPYTPSGK